MLGLFSFVFALIWTGSGLDSVASFALAVSPSV
jgi:hypothetical protein